MTEPAEEKKRPPSLYERVLNYLFVRLPVYLTIIGIGYVLSIGPLYWAWHKAAFLGQGNEYLTQIYFPLAWVCDKNENISDWVNNYIDYWVM